MNFNKEWAAKHSEAEFVEQHKHLAKADVLKKEYAKLVAKKEPAK